MNRKSIKFGILNQLEYICLICDVIILINYFLIKLLLLNYIRGLCQKKTFFSNFITDYIR